MITLYSYVTLITTDATAQSEGYGRHLKTRASKNWISYSDCCKPTKFRGLNFRSNRIYRKICEIYIPWKFPRIRYFRLVFLYTINRNGGKAHKNVGKSL